MRTAVRQILLGRTFWKPENLPNPILWDSSKPDSLTFSGNNVTSWRDVYTDKTVSGGVSPTYSNNAVNFNGSQYLLGNDVGMPTGDFTVITLSTLTTDIVSLYQYREIITYGLQTAIGNSVFIGYARGIGGTTPPDFTSFNISQYGDAIGISADHLNEETIGTVRRTGTSYVVNSFKSKAEFTASKTMPTNTVLGGAGRLNIGCETVTSPNSFFTGNIKKILIYPYVLSSTDYEKAVGWAAWSSGVQGILPTNHPYANRRP